MNNGPYVLVFASPDNGHTAERFALPWCTKGSSDNDGGERDDGGPNDTNVDESPKSSRRREKTEEEKKNGDLRRI